jgi:hypothetical protein
MNHVFNDLVTLLKSRLHPGLRTREGKVNLIKQEKIAKIPGNLVPLAGPFNAFLALSGNKVKQIC